MSFEIGARKPEIKAFQHVIDVTGHSHDSWLFIDDLKDNIDVAGSLGFNTYLHATNEPLEYIEFALGNISQ